MDTMMTTEPNDRIAEILKKNETENKLEEYNNKINLVEEDEDEEEFQPEDLAPDGGWGWLVVLGRILIAITSIGPTASFGIIFGDFLEGTGQPGTVTTVANSAFMVTFSICSLLTNVLVKKYSIRTIGLLGAVLFSVPNVVLGFMTEVYHLVLLWGLQGIGQGFMGTICNATFNAFFVKKRTKVMSAAQIIVGLGIIVYPLWIENMMKTYGFRGTAILTGAMSLNCIAAMLLMHPVEWHFRNLDEVRAERMQEGKNSRAGKRKICPTEWNNLQNFEEKGEKEVALFINTFKTSEANRYSKYEIKHEIPEVILDNKQKSDKSQELHDQLELHSLLDRGLKKSQCEDKKIVVKGKESQSGGSTLADILDVSLLKNIAFINICVGINFVFTSDYLFIVMLPLIMADKGFSMRDSATAATVSAIAELVSRILLMIFTLIVNVKAKYIYYGGMVAMVFAKFIFLLYENTLIGVLASVTIIGMIRSWIMVPEAIVIIEDLPADKFTSAYGIFAVLAGVVFIGFSPFIGIIKDWTHSFTICQLSLIAMGALFIISWGLQFYLADFKEHRRKRTAKIAAQASGHFLKG